MRKMVLVIALLLLPACALSPEAKIQLNEGAVIGDKNCIVWAELTPVQREQCHWSMVRVIHDLRYSALDVPVPEKFKGTFKPTITEEGKPLPVESDDLLEPPTEDE